MARPVIDLLGEARPALAVFQGLARRLGFDEPCFHRSEEELIQGMLTDSSFFEGIDFERLAAGGPVRVNVPQDPFSLGFKTPSGKVEFYSESLAAKGLDPLPDPTPSVDPDGEGRYPLQLITPSRHQFLNSTFNECPSLFHEAGGPTVMIHPRDAEPRGLEDEETVRVYNDRGECYVFARITEDAPAGVVVIEGLYWTRFMPLQKGINQLTSQRNTDLGGSCAFHCNLVEVESVI
jgi:anaerobic selenocysteine-containing dehydrogenase